jgi:hypothetical protein
MDSAASPGPDRRHQTGSFLLAVAFNDHRDVLHAHPREMQVHGGPPGRAAAALGAAGRPAPGWGIGEGAGRARAVTRHLPHEQGHQAAGPGPGRDGPGGNPRPGGYGTRRRRGRCTSSRRPAAERDRGGMPVQIRPPNPRSDGITPLRGATRSRASPGNFRACTFGPGTSGAPAAPPALVASPEPLPWALSGRWPAVAVGGAALLTREGGHDQLPQRSCQFALSDQDDLVIGVDVIDAPARDRPVRRRAVQGCPLDKVRGVVSITAAVGVQHPTTDAALPGQLGDHNPHPSQFVPKCPK